MTRDGRVARQFKMIEQETRQSSRHGMKRHLLENRAGGGASLLDVPPRAAGFLIGSGVIESGCKQIVTQRLKLPGAQWLLDGAILTAKARVAWLSGD